MYKRITSIFLLAVLLTACGGIDKLVTSLRMALVGGAPLVDFLVSQGKISQAKADALKTDFGDAITVVSALGDDLDAAGNDKIKQLAAAQKAEQAWLAIYGRGDFGANPQLFTVATIANGIFSSILTYFGGGPPQLTDKPSENTIKAQIDSLKAEIDKR